MVPGEGAAPASWGRGMGKGHSLSVIGLSMALGTEAPVTWGEGQLGLAEVKCPCRLFRSSEWVVGGRH